jgi:hypothetical protein
MKKIVIIVLVAIFFNISCTKGNYDKKPLLTAKIIKLNWQVEVLIKDGAAKEQIWKPAEMDSVLKEGDSIRTKNGSAEFVLSNKIDVCLKRDTLVYLADSTDEVITIRIVNGKARIKTLPTKDFCGLMLLANEAMISAERSEFSSGFDFVIDGRRITILEGIIRISRRDENVESMPWLYKVRENEKIIDYMYFLRSVKLSNNEKEVLLKEWQ